MMCDICGQGATNNTELRNHKFSKHTPASEREPKKVQCNICGSWYATKYHLQKHQKVVHLEGQFQCPHCNMKIKSKAGLKYHIKLKHEQRKPFKCTECGEAYCKNYQLQVLNYSTKSLYYSHSYDDFFLRNILQVNILVQHYMNVFFVQSVLQGIGNVMIIIKNCIPLNGKQKEIKKQRQELL